MTGSEVSYLFLKSIAVFDTLKSKQVFYGKSHFILFATKVKNYKLSI